MTWLRTALQANASATITGVVFGLPLVMWLAGAGGAPTVEILDDAPRRPVVMALPAPDPEPVVTPADDEDVGTDTTHEDAAPAPEPVASTTPAPEPSSAQVDVRRSRVSASTADGTGEAKRTRRPRRRNCAPDNPAITEAKDGTIVVDRDVVQFYARHLKALDGLGYAVAHKGDDGKATGLRVGGFKCNNDAVQAGLKNGDVIHSVNGKPVKSLVGAIWLYARMKSKDDIVLKVTRRGKPVELKYKLT